MRTRFARWAMALAAMTLTAGCGAVGIGGGGVERSPAQLEQPLNVAVDGQCHVDGKAHTIRHDIRVQRAGRLDIVTRVEEKALSAEILLKRPDGLFVRQVYTKPNQSLYRIANVVAERGTWQVHVVCRQGSSAYQMEARMRGDVAGSVP